MKVKSVILCLLPLFLPQLLKAQNRHSFYRNQFEVNSVYLQDARDYVKCYPERDIVFGEREARFGEPGMLLLVTPHPENAYTSMLSTKTIDKNNFRIWVEAWKSPTERVALFPNNNLATELCEENIPLEIKRKSPEPFFIFISNKSVKEHVPSMVAEGETGPSYPYFLRFYFARNETARWAPSNVEYAYPVGQYNMISVFHFRLHSNQFLNTTVTQSEDIGAHLYVEQHPEQDFFYEADDLWQCSGWFMKFDYIGKEALKKILNEDHYVIFSLYKDEAHTEPVTISYMKHNLFMGGWTADMEERFNYVPFPHKGFDSWTLFVPWDCVDWWWRVPNMIPTEENHICKAYYTITLSNDGETSATGNAYENSGMLAVSLEWRDNDNGTPTCYHPEIAYEEFSTDIPVATKGGCIFMERRYDVTKVCKLCKTFLGSNVTYMCIEPRCISHNMKEVSRKAIAGFHEETETDIIDGTIYEVLEECQNDCCFYRATKLITETEEIHFPPQPKCPPHDWEDGTIKKVDTQIVFKEINDKCYSYYYNIMEYERKCKKCGKTETWRDRVYDHREIIPKPVPKPKIPCDHLWHYFSKLDHRLPPTFETKTIMKPSYDEDSLCFKIGSTEFRFNKASDSKEELEGQAVTVRQWLTLNADNNYIAANADDSGLLTGLSYQEAYDFIQQLNYKVTDSLNLDLSFSMPTVEQMQQLIRDGKTKPREDIHQEIDAYYVDTIAVYDGNGRLLTDEQLSTAPEGAKVRVMVGVVKSDGTFSMVNIKEIPENTGFFLIATPHQVEVTRTVRHSGRFYYTHWRHCVRCGKTEPRPENRFFNKTYHRPIVQ